MKNEMMVFEKEEFGKVRIVMQDEQPWFVAKDVAEILGYKNSSEAVRDNCKYVEILKSSSELLLDIPSRGLQVIPESDLYRLIMRSQLESAEKFQDWVTDEVLPSIRKTGGYGINNSTQAAEELPKIAAILRASKEIAAIMGLDENHQILKANQITRQQTGFDCMKEFDIPSLEYKPNVQYHTPTVLGDMCGVSAAQMNKLLKEKGLQKETRDHKNRLVWAVTEKGKEYSRIFDTGKLHSDGSPIQQIKWSEEVIGSNL